MARPSADKPSQVARFAGDSGDGIQLQGQQFASASALAGRDLSTLSEFPAEIRAPAGTRYGVSAFQIQFGGEPVASPGDAPDVLLAFNPAALAVNLPLLEPGALIVVDDNAFTARRLKRAGLAANPLEDGSLASFQVCRIEISRLTLAAVEPFGLSGKDSSRCKNFWALGLALWLFDQPRDAAIRWIRAKFPGGDALGEANLAALHAGHAYGETAELQHRLVRRPLPEAPLAAAEYRALTGADALALGLAAAGELADLEVLFCSYPITPASALLHRLAGWRDAGVATFQAEDEIAAICAAIGASYAGRLGVSASSGPGMALKAEALGLAIAAELPLLVIDAQRAGPSTGMPTKPEQSDLHQALYGRHGDAPLPVLAARSPGDCFDAVIEAARIALRHMTPTILLTDGYLAHASELWPIPDLERYPAIGHRQPGSGEASDIWRRDGATGARLWAVPGDARHIHRVSGLEKDLRTGSISYDAANHQAMTDLRREKVERVADWIPEQRADQGPEGGLAVVAWGSTYGALHQAVKECLADGLSVAHIHLRHLNPLPRNLGSLLARYEQVLVPELNAGQLAGLLRDRLLIPAKQFNKVAGQPLAVGEAKAAIARWARGGAAGKKVRRREASHA